MSRQAQLPPRCPLQKKTTAHTSRECGHQNQYSSAPIDGLDQLNKVKTPDFFTFFDGPDQLNEAENQDSCEPENGSESSCTYGPNSPRRKNKPGLPEKEILSAFSEYAMQNSTKKLDGRVSISEINIGSKPIERHFGQRSRVRKLRYIVELERTIEILQNLRSELTVRVRSLLHQHATLSMENNTLKQQLLRMNQEKFIVIGEYQSLEKELERLKTGLALFDNNSSKSHSVYDLAHSNSIWKIIDMTGKLDLNQHN